MPAAASVTEILAALPPERRAALAQVRDVIRKHLPRGFEEAAASGMITYQVPLSRYPDTYNGQPLWLAALANQKHYMSLYLMSAYGDPAILADLKAGFQAAGKKLDMGKSCVHFRSADDLPLDVIGRIIGRISVDAWVAMAEAAKGKAKGRKKGRKV
jgi:hypothetical protein